MELITQAPALVGLYKKSIYGGCAEDDAVKRVLYAMRNVGVRLPVYYGRKKLGYVIGDARTSRARFDAASVKGLRTAMQGGQKCDSVFAKQLTGNNGIQIWIDLWSAAGNPPPGNYSSTASTAYQMDNTTPGALYHGGNVSTFQKTLVQAKLYTSLNTPVLILYDRVLGYDLIPISSAGAQTMTNGVAAARYVSAGTGGMQMLVTSSGVFGPYGSANTVTQLVYTNDAGGSSTVVPEANNNELPTAGPSSSSASGQIVVFPVSGAAQTGTSPFAILKQGDLGARSLTSISFSQTDASSSTLSVTLVRPVAVMTIPAPAMIWHEDMITGITNCEPILDGACLSMLAFFPFSNPTFEMDLEFGWT